MPYHLFSFLFKMLKESTQSIKKQPRLKRLLWLLLLAEILFLDVISGITFNWLSQKQLKKTNELIVPDSSFHHAFLANQTGPGQWGSKRITYYTNSLGFRDKEIRDVALQSDRFRILLIGDSFTEGLGATYPDSFFGQTEELLESDNVEMLNAGVTSYSPSIYYLKVKYLLEKVGLRFNHLVVFLDISDIHDEAMCYRMDEQSGNVVYSEDFIEAKQAGVPSLRYDGCPTSIVMAKSAIEAKPQPTGLAHHLKQYSLSLTIAAQIRDYLRTYSSLFPPRKTIRPALEYRSAWTYDSNAYNDYGELGLKRAEFYLTKLRELLKAQNISMSLAVYPWPFQIEKRDQSSLQSTFWRQWSKNNDVTFIDYFPLFINLGESKEVIDRYFIWGDVHWNRDGNKIVADSLARFLKMRVLRTSTSMPVTPGSGNN